MLYRDSNVKLTGPSIGLSVSKNWLSTDISGGKVGTQNDHTSLCIPAVRVHTFLSAYKKVSCDMKKGSIRHMQN